MEMANAAHTKLQKHSSQIQHTELQKGFRNLKKVTSHRVYPSVHTVNRHGTNIYHLNNEPEIIYILRRENHLGNWSTHFHQWQSRNSPHSKDGRQLVSASSIQCHSSHDFHPNLTTLGLIVQLFLNERVYLICPPHPSAAERVIPNAV